MKPMPASMADLFRPGQWRGIALLLLLSMLALVSSNPFHFKYDIPPLLYRAKGGNAAPSIPFNSFSPEEQRLELQKLLELNKVAQQVVGVYPPFLAKNQPFSVAHPSLSPNISSPEGEYFRQHISRSVVVTVANMGYLHHLRNFECFARRLNMHYLVLAVDDSLVEALKDDAAKSDSVFKVVRYPGRWTNPATPPPAPKQSKPTHPTNNSAGPSLDSAAGFQSAAFNLISLRKFEAVYDLQRLGYDVLFVDIDIVVLQDVFHVFLRPAMAEVSYLHSMNQLCEVRGEDADYLSKSIQQAIEGNTGFHFFQFPATIAKDTVQPALEKLQTQRRDGPGATLTDAEMTPRLASLLQVTETLPSVQLLYHFLRHVAHSSHFNPNAQFDDQTLFWRFMRSMRSDLNPNLVAAASGLAAGQQLLTVTGLGLCEHPRPPSKGSAAASAWFKICGLNACQFSAGAFIYYKHLFHHSSKRLDTLPSPRVVQNRLPESAYALLKHKQPALGPVIRMNTSSGVAATHRLLPRHQQYLSHILFDYTAPYPQFYLPPGVSHRSYLYSLHGNYITGAVDKQQLVQDVGFWLLEEDKPKREPQGTGPASSTPSTAYRCLQFPHDIGGRRPRYPAYPTDLEVMAADLKQATGDRAAGQTATPPSPSGGAVGAKGRKAGPGKRRPQPSNGKQ